MKFSAFSCISKWENLEMFYSVVNPSDESDVIIPSKWTEASHKTLSNSRKFWKNIDEHWEYVVVTLVFATLSAGIKRYFFEEETFIPANTLDKSNSNQKNRWESVLGRGSYAYGDYEMVHQLY